MKKYDWLSYHSEGEINTSEIIVYRLELINDKSDRMLIIKEMEVNNWRKNKDVSKTT